jgi:hypothetical protein
MTLVNLDVIEAETTELHWENQAIKLGATNFEKPQARVRHWRTLIMDLEFVAKVIREA